MMELGFTRLDARRAVAITMHGLDDHQLELFTSKDEP
jgi:hypothetical protein